MLSAYFTHAMDFTGPLTEALPLLAASAYLGTPLSYRQADAPGASAADALQQLCGGDAAALAWLKEAHPTTAIDNASMHRTLLNAGLRFTAQQSALYARVAADGAASSVISRIAEVLKDRPFFGGSSASLVDVVVATSQYDLLSLTTASLPPAVSGWFSSVVALPAVAAVLKTHGLSTGGIARIGGQVDSRASPVVVAARADASVALNSVYKTKAPAPAAAVAVVVVEVAAPPVGAAKAAAPAASGAATAAAPPAAASQPLSNKTLPGTSVDHRIGLIHAYLTERSIAHSTVPHAAANTVEELLAALPVQSGTKCKVRDERALTRYAPRVRCCYYLCKALFALVRKLWASVCIARPSFVRGACYLILHTRVHSDTVGGVCPSVQAFSMNTSPNPDVCFLRGTRPPTPGLCVRLFIALRTLQNLFVKAKKEKAPGDTRMWLVIAAHDTAVNLVSLASKLGYGKIVIRFGEADALLDNLGVVQGNVTPFALINDSMRAVNVAIDKALLDPAAGEFILYILYYSGADGVVRFRCVCLFSSVFFCCIPTLVLLIMVARPLYISVRGSSTQ